MRINGEWLLYDDGVVRPIIRGRVQDSAGQYVVAEFLLDIGADRTVLNANVLDKLGLPLFEMEEGLSGLGGGTDSVEVETKLLLTRDDGTPVVFTAAGLPSRNSPHLTYVFWDATLRTCSL